VRDDHSDELQVVERFMVALEQEAAQELDKKFQMLSEEKVRELQL
jgi:hypothetical protein